MIDLTEDKEKKEDSSFKVHFRGDTVFCNQYILLVWLVCSISAIHRINEKRYFNFNKIFNVNYSLKHDSNITHMFLSSFVCRNWVGLVRIVSQELLQKLVALHSNAEITFASHLDPTEPDRDPVTLNEGKCLLVFPPFPHMFSYGCFHSKLILIRFPDRLRVETEMNVKCRLLFLLQIFVKRIGTNGLSVFGLKISLMLLKERRRWLQSTWILSSGRDSLLFSSNANAQKIGYLVYYEVFCFPTYEFS